MAVMGAGPAGSFFSYYLLDIAERAGIQLELDVYEPRDFNLAGPAGCNNCGGIISEWLVQTLAVDGLNLPPTVVKRGIDSYTLHMSEGTVVIETPQREMRIAAVHRGAGPRDSAKDKAWGSFDGYLFDAARARGARWVRGRADGVRYENGLIQVRAQGGEFQPYDLLAVATGKQAHALKMFQGLNTGYQPPKMAKTYICEIYLGEQTVTQYLGSSFHVFLLDLPHLKFSALIPKGDYVTLCLLGTDIDKELIEAFVSSPQVRDCMPPGWEMPASLCHCAPYINLAGAARPFADRLVFIGDCSISRLYKDGIGAAYRTAKAAATTAILQGVSEADFQKHYWPTLQAIASDNQFGRLIFLITSAIQKLPFTRRGLLRMVGREQTRPGSARRMSGVLWDTFTGSAPYQDVFVRTLHPAFLARYISDSLAGLVPHSIEPPPRD